MRAKKSLLREFPLDRVFTLIEPGPLAMVTTSHKGKPNVMTMSWLMMVDFVPPYIACVMSPTNHSFKALRATKECVIAIVTTDLAKTAVDIGNCSGADLDKFTKFGLATIAAEKVSAPLLPCCLYNIECRVVNTTLTGKYCLFVLEAVKAWQDPTRKERRRIHANGDGTFIIDGRVIDLKKRMTKFPDIL